MKSSEERPREADMVDGRSSEGAPAITQDEVRAMMTEESIWSYRLRKFDPGVQLGRLALILGFWWLWWSELRLLRARHGIHRAHGGPQLRREVVVGRVGVEDVLVIA